MGILVTDVTPLGANGPSALTPVSKDVSCKVFQTARTDTVAVTKCVLPADSTVLSMLFYGGTASNAGTTATVTYTITNNGGTISTGVVDVKTNGATTAVIQMSALPNLQPIPLNGDLQIKAVYAETGGASSAGGPWLTYVEYVR